MPEPAHDLTDDRQTRPVWRSPGPVAVRDGAGGDFAYADLRGVRLAGWQLQGANFRGARLQGADLRGADVRGTIFDGADLTAADCTAALMQGARLRRARLDGACLRQAWLLSAHLEWASVQGADFTGANCEWAWVEGVDFPTALVACALFLNVRGLATTAQRSIEARGGFTGTRPLLLGRELYDRPLPDADRTPAGGRGEAWPRQPLLG